MPVMLATVKLNPIDLSCFVRQLCLRQAKQKGGG